MGCFRSKFFGFSPVTSTSNPVTELPPTQKSKQSKLVPQTFKDKYSKGQQLGKGGYSIVYEVTNKTTGHKYAVKEVTRASLKQGDEELLRQEIEIMQSLQHPHIVRFIVSYGNCYNNSIVY